ncbi:MAG: tRNA-dihydrouridine synthase family protein, partial [Muribaculaceae bacterium]|nr:tRNA-dihydrouridine synthase family protein [Muribaculaceae bacterium]
MTEFHFAPVQGHTDAPYRHFHNKIYKGNRTFYTPFIRLEHGGLRTRDYKDFTSPLNYDTPLIPQIIFKDEQELTTLISKIKETGAKRIDLNMGCPFPLQTGHGRGAATISNPSVADTVAKAVNDNRDISFSVKIRLGLTDPDEWKKLIPVLNGMDLSHITVHPRIAKQQYSG